MNQISHSRLPLAEAGVCVIAGYFALSFIFSDFSISAVFGAAVYFAFAAVCFVLFFVRKEWKEKKPQSVDILLLIFLLTVCFNICRNFTLDHTVLYYIIILGSSIILFWSCGTVPRKSITVAKGFLIGIALFFSIVNILYLFAPEIVTNAAFRLISQTSADYITRISWEGYGYAFGEDVGYTAEVIIMGICLLCTGMTVQNWMKRAPLLLIMSFALISVQRRGEFLVCIVVLVLVTVVGLIKRKQLKIIMEKPLRKLLIPIVTQGACIAVAFLLFFSINTNSRFSALEQELIATSQATVVETTAVQEEFFDQNTDANADSQTGNEQESTGTETTETEEASTDLEQKLEQIGNGRLILWQLAWEGFLESPILGHGWGAYATIAPASGNTQVINAHCIYLQLLCETGIVGFLLVGGVFVGFLLLILKKIKACTNWQRFCDYQVALFILLFILGDGLIDNSLYQTHWMMLLTVALMLVFHGAEPETVSVQEENVD
jgi:hypothetical protein